MKKILSLIIVIMGLASFISAQIKEGNVKNFLENKNVLQAVKSTDFNITTLTINKKYQFGEVIYKNDTIGSFIFQTYGRAHTQGHPEINVYECLDLKLIHLTFNGENEMRANTVSRDLLWIEDMSGRLIEVDLQFKVINYFKFDGKQIQFLNGDHPHAYHYLLYSINPEKLNYFTRESCELF